MQHTIVEYVGKQNRSRCGYCRNSNTSNAHGMHAYAMKPTDYQDLIDRGWRRSGDYCYKPNNASTCCPSYTIRCDAHEFKLSKSQKKVLKRMNRFLQNGHNEKDEGHDGADGGVLGTEKRCEQEADESAAAGLSREEPDIPEMELKDIEVNGVREQTIVVPDSSTGCGSTDIDIDGDQSLGKNQQCGEKRRDEVETSSSQETLRPPCKKAKQMRLERRQAKLASKGITEDAAKSKKSSASQEKTLSDFIEEELKNPRHKLTVVIVPSNKGVTKPVLELYRKYQCIVHKDPPQKLTQKSYERFLVRTPLQLKFVEVRSQEFKDTLSVTYGLYNKYQTIIHNDPNDRDDYLYFLQNSPLQCTKTLAGPEQGYGSFHQQYWLDDRLIAVGVIDILPYCVSSVYFFYDPEFNFLSLGTYGSLREVYLTKQLNRRTPALQYYYMGFYIHTCPKMMYKGRLSSSYLLCPEVYSWHLLTDDIRKRLDEKNYLRLNPDLDAKDVNYFREEDLDAVLILYDRNSFTTYRNFVQDDSEGTRAEILEYGQLVGRQCAHRMLYVKM